MNYGGEVLLSIFFLICFVFNSYASQAYENWMEIRPKSGENEKPIGYTRTKIELKDENINIHEENRLKIKVFSYGEEIVNKTNITVKNDIIDSFSYEFFSSSQSYRISGENKNGKLLIKSVNNKNTYKTEFDIDNNFIAYSYLPLWLSKGRLLEGSKYEIYLFDPLMVVSKFSKDKFKAEINVMFEEELNIDSGNYKAYKINLTFLDSRTTLWVTEEGEKIKSVIPPDFVAFKSSEKKISGLSLKKYDLTAKTAITSNVDISKPRETKYMKFSLQQVDQDGFYKDELFLIDNYSQFVDKGFYVVRADEVKSDELTSEISDGLYNNYLLSTNFVQSEDKRIKKTLKSIIGKNTDKFEGIKKINEWIYKNLKKTPTFGVPNALDVLKTMKGDCNEHAVLFAALSRAYKVPTKIILGLVYLDGKFYYHAWNEVYFGQWITVDSSFNQLPADATHIKLLEGSIGKGPELLNLVGKLNIEILEVY